MVLDILGYIGAAIALLSYFGMTLGWWKPIVFDWANATTVFPITASAIQHGAYVGVILPVTFGLIGWLGIIRRCRALHPRRVVHDGPPYRQYFPPVSISGMENN